MFVVPGVTKIILNFCPNNLTPVYYMYQISPVVPVSDQALAHIACHIIVVSSIKWHRMTWRASSAWPYRVVRTDGSCEDFSYRKCVVGTDA